MRQPLTFELEPREADVNKDCSVSNVFYDKEEDKVYAVKRPGIATYISGSGTAQGIFGWQNKLFHATSTPVTGYFDIFAYGNGMWVGGSSDGAQRTLAYSTDGIVWTVQTIFASNTVLGNLTYAGSYFYALQGGNTSLFYYSSDGIVWNSANFPASITNPSVAYNSGVYVVAGGSRVFYSNDGVTWFNSSLAIATRQAVVWDGTYFLVWGTGGTYRSNDGNTWTNQGTTPGSGRFAAVDTSTGTVVSSNGSSYRVTTDHGVTWTTLSLPSGPYEYITFDGSRFLMPSTTTTAHRILVSSDGITWTSSYTWPTILTNVAMVAYGNGRYIIGASFFSISFSGTGQYSYSSDLTNWTTTNITSTTITVY